jgi:poly(3-hydroxybutyrate) depolymerase
MHRLAKLLALIFLVLIVCDAQAAERLKLAVPSSVDQIEQTCYLHLPKGYDPNGGAVPLVVSVHSWSGDVEQRNVPLENAAELRGWLVLMPNFRGRNDHPEACGSTLAQQDILDAVAWVSAKYPVDRRRIYLTGSSGGGHMTMLMAGRHPQVWAAASAWVGINNLAAWHTTHASDRYGQNMRDAAGGAPGSSVAVDNEYRQRSPMTHLAGAVPVPLDIAAGCHDGHRGSVPIRHSLDAFNVVARAQNAPVVSEAEILELSTPGGRLSQPQPSDYEIDPSFNRAIYLRRQAGKCRVTIFEGGHEGLAEAAIEFLSRHTKPE